MPCGNNVGTGGFGAAGPVPGGTGGGIGAGGGDGQVTKLLGLAGKPLTVTLGIPLVADACGTVKKVDDVATEVFDPSNHKVEHTKTAPRQGLIDQFGFQQSGFLTEVTFTPAVSGSYHLAARFEPTLGNAQMDVDVASDRTGEPSKTLALGTTCTALEVMPSGLVLCLKDTDQLVMFRDEMSLAQVLDADDFAIAGDVVWTARFGLIKRYVDVGGATPLGMLMAFDTGLSDRATLVATPNDVVFVGSNAAVQIRVQGSVLAETARVYPAGIGWLVHPTPIPGLLLLASSSQFNGTGFLCITRMESGTSPTCTNLPGAVLGADQSGVWINTGGQLMHQRWEGPADGGAVVRTTMPFPGLPVVTPSRHYQSAPVFEVSGRNIVPRLGPDGFELDGYELPQGYRLVPGSTKMVRAQNASTGAQRLFTRP